MRFRQVPYLLLIAMVLSSGAAEANETDSPAAPLAEVIPSAREITFIPRGEYRELVFRTRMPDGKIIQKTFSPGQAAVFQLPPGTPDGICRYEMWTIPTKPAVPVRKVKSMPLAARRTRTQSGSFRVLAGAIVTPRSRTRADHPQDIVHGDDVIITGNLCVGPDCTDDMEFYENDLILKGQVLRIFFDDTSSAEPYHDWRIVINDPNEGGDNYFAIKDPLADTKPFWIAPNQRNNALVIDDSYGYGGGVGLGTALPETALHIKSSYAEMRFDQDGSAGNIPRKWDIGASVFGDFHIRDVNTWDEPFYISQGAPDYSIFIESNGDVGFGTVNPQFTLHAQTTGENCMLVLDRTDGAQFKLSCVTNKVQIGAQSNHDVRFTTNNIARMVITKGGNVGVNQLSPTHLFEVGSSGAYCNGGAWVDGSSRAFKTDIRALDGGEAEAAVMNLRPVKFRYKADTAEEYLGFIAEDVPDLVAMKDRRGMTAMDVVAALTRVVQQQQATIRGQEKVNNDQQSLIMEQKRALQDLQRLMREQAKVVRELKAKVEKPGSL